MAVANPVKNPDSLRRRFLPGLNEEVAEGVVSSRSVSDLVAIIVIVKGARDHSQNGRFTGPVFTRESRNGVAEFYFEWSQSAQVTDLELDARQRLATVVLRNPFEVVVVSIGV